MTETKLSKVKYTISDALCDKTVKKAFQVVVGEVLGDSRTVAAGKAFLVRGTYKAKDQTVSRLCLTALGRSEGKPADIVPGSGKFEVTARVLEVVAGREAVLDLVAFSGEKELGVRLRIQLKK